MAHKREVIDIGNVVLCDICNRDYTNSDAKGGFLFESKAICPECAPEFEAGVKKYHEEKYIRDRVRPDETFAQACLRWRGGDNTITIVSW